MLCAAGQAAADLMRALGHEHQPCAILQPPPRSDRCLLKVFIRPHGRSSGTRGGAAESLRLVEHDSLLPAVREDDASACFMSALAAAMAASPC